MNYRGDPQSTSSINCFKTESTVGTLVVMDKTGELKNPEMKSLQK